jgi:predicted enzyme related to lactoylglutathione lyase
VAAYIVVDDLAAAAEKAVALGATVVRDAAKGPAGTSVWIADPSGAQVALFKPFPVKP